MRARNHVDYSGTAAEGSSVSGGPGDDVLLLVSGAHDLVVDNSVGHLTEDGRATLPWTSVENFTVRTTHEDQLDLTFWGTGADERPTRA